MKSKNLGLKLIDAISVSVNELPAKINCLNSLGYRTDVSTTFKKEVSSFLGQDVIEAEYTLLIYKEQSNE
ncbi:MAG: hypothetical protein DUD32_12635 [Lactobacillus sp.]|nr:MAG: hypothetical protein DUD32_12635 [Lactobacillus sp.]